MRRAAGAVAVAREVMLFRPFTASRLALATALGVFFFPSVAPAQVREPISPKGVHGFFVQANQKNRGLAANATATFAFLVWNGPSAETDTVCTMPDTVLTCVPLWQGYRVRRTIEGITPRLEVVGQWKSRDTVVPLCLTAQAPCDVQDFVFTGAGVFFKGFRNNRRPDGTYVLPYPPGSPADSDNTARIFVDTGVLAGF